MNKDIEQLLAELRRQGFTVRVRKTGHYRVTAPSGDHVTVPGTPCGGRSRSLLNARAALRRIGADL